MVMIRKLFNFLNPLEYLGKRSYSVVYPLVLSTGIALLSELVAYRVLDDPRSVGSYIIFTHIALIVYLAFRSGIAGGLAACGVAASYYLYIILTREFSAVQVAESLRVTALLSVIYVGIALIIGFLKEKIDTLIEREANERRRLQTILDQLPVGVLVADASSRIAFGNKQIHTFLGEELKRGFKVGQDTLPGAMFQGNPVSPEEWPIVEALSHGKLVEGREYTLRRKDGSENHFRISAAPVTNSRGLVFAAATILQDITAQKELETRKDDFVNMASHELKTPITSMKLYLDTLLSRMDLRDTGRIRKTLTSIRTQTGKLEELVSELLDVTRIQTGKLMLHTEPFSISGLARELAGEFSASSPDHRVRFLGRSGIVVTADRFRISQVLTNLLANAIKYSPSGGKIDVAVEKTGKNVKITIHDSGIGIGKNEQAKIFDRLYRVAEPTESTYPGLGMGLYISREIVQRHRGSITVDSELGRGSTFTVTIPQGNITRGTKQRVSFKNV